MGDVFTWLDEAFIPTIYDAFWYNGDERELADQHTFGPGHTRMVGGWRILQVGPLFPISLPSLSLYLSIYIYIYIYIYMI